MKILETKRHLLRTMNEDDFPALCAILQDPLVMHAYAHAFSDEEVHDWLKRQMTRYAHDGFDLWALIRKSDGAFIGQCGITMQEVGKTRVPELGWLLRRDCWHQGHASEAALACRAYAFDQLGYDEVFAIIRDTNTASQRVARRIGMTPRFTFIKHYYGIDMPHIVFSIKK